MLHFAFYVEDVEAIYQKALAHGAKAYVEPGVLSLGEPPLIVKNAVIHSPNGEIIEFMEEADFSPTRHGKINP
ncbi:Glyoxalase-like domain protein [compost metagenome]